MKFSCSLLNYTPITYSGYISMLEWNVRKRSGLTLKRGLLWTYRQKRFFFNCAGSSAVTAELPAQLKKNLFKLLRTVFRWVKKFQGGECSLWRSVTVQAGLYLQHNKEKHWCREAYGRRRWPIYYFPNRSYYRHFRRDHPSYSDWPFEIKAALC